MNNKIVSASVLGVVSAGFAIYGFANLSKKWGGLITIIGGTIAGLSIGYIIGQTKNQNDTVLAVSSKNLSV